MIKKIWKKPLKIFLNNRYNFVLKDSKVNDIIKNRNQIIINLKNIMHLKIQKIKKTILFCGNMKNVIIYTSENSKPL